MHMLILAIAGLFEAAWSYTLKLSEGMSRLAPAALTVVFMELSVYLLSVAMRNLPLSVAYPVWTGIGAVGSAALGFVVLGEAGRACGPGPAAGSLSAQLLFCGRSPTLAWAGGRETKAVHMGWGGADVSGVRRSA